MKKQPEPKNDSQTSDSNDVKNDGGIDCASSIVRRCPVCGKPPIIRRYKSGYWYARCAESHLADSSAHPMKTQKVAWMQWDNKFPPNS